MSDSDPVLVERGGAVGRIRLNSPTTLNALTGDSIGAIAAALEDFCADDGVATVLIDHVGGKGFCAGGDAAGLANSARGDGRWAHDYFSRQYAMDAQLADFPKPIITVADGATIGGGLGLLLGARRRVVTERSMIAFLEASIGMAPDVGASWVLPRLPGARGTWLALTGAKLIGRAAVDQGLADSFVDSADLEARKQALVADPSRLDELFPLTAAETPATDGPVARHFAHGSAGAIVRSLEEDESEWASKQLVAIRRASPTAIVATFALLEAGAAANSLEAALDHELRTNMALLQAHDFLSFARANLLERDAPVSWSPAMIEDVPTPLFAAR